MKRTTLIIGMVVSMFAVTLSVGAQDLRQSRKFVRHGNRHFRAERFEDANVEYRKALDADSTNTVARYNLCRSMFPQDWLNVKALSKAACDTICNGFLRAAEEEQDPVRKSMSYYNIGVLYQRLGGLQQAIDAYKEALRQNPADDEARYNLVVCKRQLKNQPQQQNQDDQQDQNSDKQKKDEEKKQEQQKQDQQQKQQEQQQQQQQQEPPMSKENAEQLLNNAKREENQTQKRMQRIEQQSSNRKEKNW